MAEFAFSTGVQFMSCCIALALSLCLSGSGDTALALFRVGFLALLASWHSTGHTRTLDSHHLLAIFAGTLPLHHFGLVVLALGTGAGLTVGATSSTGQLLEVEQFGAHPAVVVGVTRDPHVAVLSPVSSPLVLHDPVLACISHQLHHMVQTRVVRTLKHSSGVVAPCCVRRRLCAVSPPPPTCTSCRTWSSTPRSLATLYCC